MRRDATASKCFVQLGGYRILAGDKATERPSLPAIESVSFQNYVGLRGWTRTGRPYPTFHGIHKLSTCGFDFTDCAMLEGSRPGPVNRHGFEIAGWAGARLAPTMGRAPAGWPLGGWRPAPRKRKTAAGGTRDAPRAPGRRAAALPPPSGRAPRAGLGIAVPPPGPEPRLLSPPAPSEVFQKLSLHRRGSSRIVLLRTGA